MTFREDRVGRVQVMVACYPDLKPGVKFYRDSGGPTSGRQGGGKKTCKACRKRVRGPNHDQGAHHNGVVHAHGRRRKRR